MNLLVLFQVRARTKLLVAEGAGEGLLTRVYPLVTYQIRDLNVTQIVLVSMILIDIILRRRWIRRIAR